MLCPYNYLYLTKLQLAVKEIAFTEEYVNEMTNHRYRVVRMWEQDSALFLDNPALLPLYQFTKILIHIDFS
ncbi:hypothetical protein LC607_24990 [Nostoc sp. CHAB 5824]|nr:hypothetical protein [Nostoc sp. CHAB 5824]